MNNRDFRLDPINRMITCQFFFSHILLKSIIFYWSLLYFTEVYYILLKSIIFYWSLLYFYKVLFFTLLVGAGGKGGKGGGGGGGSTLSSVASILGMKGITITKDTSSPSNGVPNSLINIKVSHAQRKIKTHTPPPFEIQKRIIFM